MSGGGDREQILGRVREALRVPAPHLHEQPAKAAGGNGSVTAPFREWLPQPGAGFDQWLALFAKQSEMLKTEFHECAHAASAAAQIAKLAEEGGWKRLAVHDGPLIDELAPHLPGGLELFRVGAGYDKDAFESCEGGVSECESLVAQTGSICVTARSSGGRALSALPPHHIVVARREQLLPDLPAAYERLAAKYGDDYPSFIGFITGPSRTGDIERILVLGAHGPKRLSVLLLP